MSAPADKASGRLWDGALNAQHVFGDLDGHRPELLGVHDAFDDGTAYRAELSARVDHPVLSDDPILQHDLRLPGSWWDDLTKARRCRQLLPTVSPYDSSTWTGRSPSSSASQPRP
ncbi:hypothetical protein STAFG_3615 [Streptomyces afghaniensis 772]|uniref:Uncharacterized protein n=1 Tax=Streptomyces afghaniensis 772 TaxID=1283301 RepID=S4NLX4_9ACTN|nr:hypothetical protein [Streptomyces afghaniensis]EPJ39344.1 hypothetical protein STAFG_3615 [Streptomyces afghaniensis 772]